MAIKYNAIFSKKSDMVYISHLDLMNLLRRAFRRTGLPIFITKGFTPRVKLSIPQALKLGKESDHEEMSFWLEEDVENNLIKEKINSELPEGVEVREVFRED